MDVTDASRALLLELVTYLRQRHVSTESAVADYIRTSKVRAEDLDRRHTGLVEHVERLAERVNLVSAQLQHRAELASSHVENLRAINHALKNPSPHPTRASTARMIDVTPNGYVKSFKPGKVLLRVENLSKEIGGTDILTDINFEIFENEILGLIGPNGAGKTTLMECLANLRPRTSGTFYEGDVAPTAWNPRRLMFYLPNGMTPYAELYTIQVLTLFGKMFEVQPARWERIIVDELGLVPMLQKKVSTLSKGWLQRLLIALALMSPQPLLALDEPFDGLDLHQTQAMMDILRALRAQPRTLLLCIHQLNDAERICDRLLLLSGGRMVGMGTLEQLRAQASLSQGSLEDIFMALTGRRATLSAH